MNGNGNSRQNKIRLYTTSSDFPTEGKKGAWYFAEDTGFPYIWDGSSYQDYDDALKKDGSVALTSDWNAGNFKITAGELDIDSLTLNDDKVVSLGSLYLRGDSSSGVIIDNLDDGKLSIIKDQGTGNLQELIYKEHKSAGITNGGIYETYHLNNYANLDNDVCTLNVRVSDVGSGTVKSYYTINLLDEAGDGLQSRLDINHDGVLNLPTAGSKYQIGSTDVLDATTLGSGVVNSSLTSVGTLGSLNVSGDIFSIGKNVGLGDIEGFVVKYSSTTAVAITSGWLEANGEYYELSSDTTHNMTSLASAFDHHYIYIDDSESTSPTATIIDSTTEPSWSDSKRGWYNGDDRCIGSVASTDGASTIIDCIVNKLSEKVIEIETVASAFPTMALNMTPAGGGSLATPNLNDGSVITPITAQKIKYIIQNTDTTSNLALYIASVELASVVKRWIGYDQLHESSDMMLGESRNVLIGGNSGDDSNLTLTCHGYTYKR